MNALLEIRGLHAGYGNAQVLHGIDLVIGPGEIVSLLGRNGAGRSTLAKALMGIVPACGSVRLHGAELLGRKPFEIARMGLGYVPENRDIFPTLTVEQNLLLGQKPGKASRWTVADMYALFPRLRERCDVPGGVLSGGEQQMLALCRSLLGDPALMVVDEPTEGLAPQAAESVGQLLATIRDAGVSILLIEQKLTIALRISQRVAVMGHGAIVYEGTPQMFAEADAVRREWLEV